MITTAAIKIDQIYTGRSHAEICLSAIRDKLNPVNRKVTEGFLTDKNVFLTRKEAADHAFECGQIKEKKFELFSYDLEEGKDG
jgi:hypothetical protein